MEATQKTKIELLYDPGIPLLGIYLKKCKSRHNETIWFEGKWMQLEDIMLSEVSQAQKDKDCMFSLICGRQTQYKYKQYYEKQFIIRGGQ
jgi:hypothetical protein